MRKQVAVITGGSQGLGLAMAEWLVARGWRVVLAARSMEKLESARRQLAAGEGEVLIFSVDIANYSGLEEMAQYIRSEVGGIDLLINNAGVFSTDCIEDMSVEAIERDINVSLTGSILCTRACVGLLRPGSRLLFISSAYGIMGAAGYAVYCAVKAGLIRFAEAMRRELRSREIAVYVALPADIDTPAFHAEPAGMPEWLSMAQARPTPLAADVAAHRILSQCHGGRLLIFTDMTIRLLNLLQKAVPRFILDPVLDKMFPEPTKVNPIRDVL